MRLLLIEDEQPAYRRLAQLLRDHWPAATIEPQLDTVTQAVAYLRSEPAPDLVFMDIQLADGLSFQIFEQVDVKAPIIFTTAYDQYTLRAFKVHSIDYLLKPIDPEELKQALEKFTRIYGQSPAVPANTSLLDALRELQQPKFRERFLIKVGASQLSYLAVGEVAYFYSDQSMVFAKRHDGRQHHLETTLDQLEEQLDPTAFFRISRKAIIGPPAIDKIETYFNGRLLLLLKPAADFQVTVSRDRVNDFKKWLDH
ncbi:MAG: response regulator transcription factor [Lewinella sp.]|nr:response regulator transcription factor [Lewinella sp.]